MARYKWNSGLSVLCPKNIHKMQHTVSKIASTYTQVTIYGVDAKSEAEIW